MAKVVVVEKSTENSGANFSERILHRAQVSSDDKRQETVRNIGIAGGVILRANADVPINFVKGFLLGLFKKVSVKE